MCVWAGRGCGFAAAPVSLPPLFLSLSLSLPQHTTISLTLLNSDPSSSHTIGSLSAPPLSAHRVHRASAVTPGSTAAALGSAYISR